MNKRIFREIRANLGRYIALLLLTAIAVGMYVGFLSGTNSAKQTFEDYLEENRLEDGYVTLDGKLDADIQSDVEELGVTVYENYYADEDAEDGSVVRVFHERTEVDLPWVKEGALPAKADEIFLDQIYANEKGITVGSAITLDGMNYTVSGIGSFPDYTISLETASQMLADRSTFGVAMVSEDAFSALNQNNITYNYAFTYKENLTAEEKKETLRDIVKTIACVALIENYGKLDEAFDKMSDAAEITAYSSIESNQRVAGVVPKMESNTAMATMFVGVVILIIAFLYVIFTKQTIQQECTVLGTLLALGVRKGGILLSYLGGPCLVTFIGSVVGIVLGEKKLYMLPINSFNGYYSIPECPLNVENSVFLTALLVPVILIAVINVIAITRQLHRKPLQLIRRDIQRNRGSRRSHFNLGSFEFRFRFRMFTRSIGVYFLLFVGIFLGGWLMMFGVGMSSSFDGYIKSQEEQAVSQYQYAVSDEYQVDNADAEEATVSAFDYQPEGSSKTYNITGIGVSTDSQFFAEVPELSYGEIVVTEAFSKKFSVGKNDVITLENAATGETADYRVLDVQNYNLGLSIFISRTEMNNILSREVTYHNYYFSDSKLDIPKDNLVSETSVEDYVANGKVIKAAMQSMIILFPAVAVIVYLIIMYILVKLIISQNEVGISMMKVFGFDEKEINRMYVRTNTIVTVILVLAALPLQYMLMVSIWPSCIATIPGYVDFIMNTTDFILIGLTGILCYFLASAASLRKVRKVPMVIALKNQDS